MGTVVEVLTVAATDHRRPPPPSPARPGHAITLTTVCTHSFVGGHRARRSFCNYGLIRGQRAWGVVQVEGLMSAVMKKR